MENSATKPDPSYRKWKRSWGQKEERWSPASLHPSGPHTCSLEFGAIYVPGWEMLLRWATFVLIVLPTKGLCRMSSNF